MLGELERIFEDIWEKKRTPSDFGDTKMTAILKNKGSGKDPKCYRIIQSSKLLSKLLSVLILQRISS